ncbi:putative lipid II flippase FtsW [Patescibacteria group bacterium]|nr:putative lipid II flippase FtsW [Patescibacteria group bacterium]
MKKFFSHPPRAHAPDYVIVVCTFLLVVIGLVMLTSASSDLGQLHFQDSYFYLKHQILYGLSIGIVLFFAAAGGYYRQLEKIATPLLIFNFVLLGMIFTHFGVASGGSTRWLQLGPIAFQPSELLKISFIVYLASWLSSQKKRNQDLMGGYIPFLVILGITCGLLVFQPSTSTAAMLTVVALVMYFVSGARVSYIAGTFAVGILILGALLITTPYRLQRVMTFLHPNANTQGSSYQLNQALIAIGSGGWWGVGYGQSTSKLHSLPQPIDDSIFAVVAEELGFIGVLFIIGLFLILILRSFILASRAPDSFGQLLLVGFGVLIAVQAAVHIASNTGMVPLTGVPLPFISYGGTALAIFMAISGIMVNISRYI